MHPTLIEVLEYTNPAVLERYKMDYPLNKFRAEEALIELIKYLWLSNKHKQDKIINPSTVELDFVCAIHTEMSEIDDMWHTFLLFTQDYMAFCYKYFGKFMHHLPNSHDEELDKKEFTTDFIRYLQYAQKNLGNETLLKWFQPLLN